MQVMWKSLLYVQKFFFKSPGERILTRT